MAQVSLNTRVSPELFEKLDKYTKESGKSKAAVVQEALEQYLNKEKEC